MEKRKWIKELCTKEKVSMVGVQEMKQKVWGEEQAAKLWGFNDGDYIHSEARGNSGGLLLMWNKTIFKCEFVII